jgi:hypothetical protein
MKKIALILMSLIFCTLQSCKEENSVGVYPLIFQIGIVDMEGNDLLDPSFEGNIVSENPTMIDIWGNEVKSALYTDESFLYNQGKGFLIIDHWKAITTDGVSHYILPGGPYFRSYSSNGWFENKEIIIKWGSGIENDTIVFSGGWKEDWGPGIANISINGKELEHSKDIAYYGDYHFIYRKDMSKKK